MERNNIIQSPNEKLQMKEIAEALYDIPYVSMLDESDFLSIDDFIINNTEDKSLPKYNVCFYNENKTDCKNSVSYNLYVKDSFGYFCHGSCCETHYPLIRQAMENNKSNKSDESESVWKLHKI